MKKDQQIVYKHSSLVNDLLTEMPKLELHRHLEGSYPIDSLFKLAQKNQLDVPSTLESFKESFQFPKEHEPDFLLFLSKFKKFWYKDLNDITSIAYDTVKSFAEENLFYIELRFNPLHFTALTHLDPNEVTRTIIAACDRAAKDYNIQIRYILTFNRGVQTADEMILTYNTLKDSDLTNVVGVDLAGDELGFPPELFRDFFDLIKNDGLFGIDIHAGEITDSKNMWVAIEQLHADRIGHGVSAVFDKNIQDVLKKKNIFLAQCITSNYQTGAWRNESDHPMKILVESGVPITIGSDDPTIQDSNLIDDYSKTILNFNWNFQRLIEINLNAIKGTFLSPKEKSLLTKRYKVAIDKFLKKNKGALLSISSS